jgi:hypothetical protein
LPTRREYRVWTETVDPRRGLLPSGAASSSGGRGGVSLSHLPSLPRFGKLTLEILDLPTGPLGGLGAPCSVLSRRLSLACHPFALGLLASSLCGDGLALRGAPAPENPEAGTRSRASEHLETWSGQLRGEPAVTQVVREAAVDRGPEQRVRDSSERRRRRSVAGLRHRLGGPMGEGRQLGPLRLHGLGGVARVCELLALRFPHEVDEATDLPGH